MKKLRYGCAVVSFCPDLTNAKSASLPLAGLLIGEVGDEPVAVVAWIQLPDEAFQGDRLAAAIMHDLPSVLRSHIDEAWENIVDGSLGAEAVLAELHNSLRTSLHVSEISEMTEREVEKVQDVPGILVHEISRRLYDVIHKHLPSAPANRTVPSTPPVVLMGAATRLVEKADQPDGIEFWKMKRKPQHRDEGCFASAE